MIKFDFNTYVNSFIDENDYKTLMNRKEEVLDKFNNSTMTGWTKEISEELKNDLKNTAKSIKNSFDCLQMVKNVIIPLIFDFIRGIIFYTLQR